MTKTEYFHIDIYETYTTKILLAEEFGTHVEDSFLDGSVKICRQKTFRVGYFAQIIFCSLFVHYLHVKKCVLLRFFSRT